MGRGHRLKMQPLVQDSQRGSLDSKPRVGGCVRKFWFQKVLPGRGQTDSEWQNLASSSSSSLALGPLKAGLVNDGSPKLPGRGEKYQLFRCVPQEAWHQQ